MVDNGNLAITFTSVFFLGLGLNLTPCVYPMLSITVSLFRGNGEPLHGHAFPKALAYVLGMVTMYSGLGLLAAYTGSFFGEFLQNFWVQLSVGILVTGLAFSMLGLYQFRLPSWLIPSGGWSSKHTCLSLYASGALVGIIAAPCMGPAVLALLTYVSTLQNAFLGFLLFFVMALGLGLPYLVLGTFSGLLKKLPKSGAWLVWFERVFGVVLLTFGAFYITIAFQWPVLKWIVPGALLGGGIYLGWWERSDRYSKMFVMIKRTLGTLAFFAGLFFVLMGPRQGIVWEPYRAGIFGEAQVSGQPVVLDFYADW
ncbi:MAG TPA: cytochrome c biogenesis protein CcdA [Candidatus Omnitrophota bacterium]|nr:cytochrome c biogenesis protein CcdA [Candidatus Omnitrophota bacterium]